MGRKAKAAVCSRDCFFCIHPDCILDAGPNLEEYRLSVELDRVAWLEAQEPEEELSRWKAWHHSRQGYYCKERAAWQAAYRESNRDACNAKRREHRAAHRDAFNAYQRAYRAKKRAERG